MTPSALPTSTAFLEFWRERRLCTVTTLRPDGSPHVVPMGFVIDADQGTAWAITAGSSRKVSNVRSAGEGGALIAVCQVDGRRWSTLEGRVRVLDDQGSVAEAVRRYAERYRMPRQNPERVALHVVVNRVLGNAG
ncbi:TIGR03618 family F420-dependent PPOX class oxidoreductase [soil metagenome]